MIKDSKIVFGYLWPNPYYQIEEDLIVCTPSRSSIVTGVTTSGTTTLVDPPSPSQELHKVPLPPPTLPELPELPGISNFNRRTEALPQRVEAHNWHLRELPLSSEQRLEALLAHIRSGENLDEVAFTEGHITYRQLQRINQSANLQFYTEVSELADTGYQPPHFQDISSQGEEECPFPYQTHREPFRDPAFRAQLQRAILREHERLTGQTPWNNNRGNVPATGIRLNPEAQTQDITHRVQRVPEAPPARAETVAENQQILLDGLADTRRQLLTFFIILVVLNILLNILLHHLVYIQFFWAL